MLLLLCATVACAVQLYVSMQYGNAMVQRLSGGLAQQIAQREAILDTQGRVDRSALKPLFDRLMTFNPSVELYVVSPDGDILADAAPPGHIQRQKIDLAPIQNFLSGTVMPVFGDDPRSQNKKVFSATPLRQDGELKGYLYIILQGEESNALAEMAWHKALWSTALWSMLLVALFGLLAGLLLWYWVTRPVKQLTLDVAGLEQDSISAIKQLAAQPLQPAGQDPAQYLYRAGAQNHLSVGSAGRQRPPAAGVYRQHFARLTHPVDVAAGLSGNAVAEIRHAVAAGASAVPRYRAASGAKGTPSVAAAVRAGAS